MDALVLLVTLSLQDSTVLSLDFQKERKNINLKVLDRIFQGFLAHLRKNF